MKKIICLAVFSLFLFPGVSNAQQLPDITLELKNFRQETSMWCWAAVAQQILGRRLGAATPSQCELVGLSTDGANEVAVDCCLNTTPGYCLRPGSMMETINLIRRFGGNAQVVSIPETPEDVHRILSSGQALIISAQESAYVGHAYVVKGIKWDVTVHGTIPTLLINDPGLLQPTEMPFWRVRPFWKLAIVAS